MFQADQTPRIRPRRRTPEGLLSGEALFLSGIEIGNFESSRIARQIPIPNRKLRSIQYRFILDSKLQKCRTSVSEGLPTGWKQYLRKYQHIYRTRPQAIVSGLGHRMVGSPAFLSPLGFPPA